MTVTDTATTRSELAATLTRLAPTQGLWINGRGHDATGTFPVTDPATEQVITRIADGDEATASAAVDAAAGALPGWAATAPRVRSEALRRAFDLMVAEADTIAELISTENGKSLADARAEATYAAEFFRWFSEEAVRSDGDFGSSPAGGTRTVVTSRPVGVAALVTPWNFPAAMATRKIAPALAAGCTVVVKPAGETPLTALYIVQLLTRAGVPDGVVNLVPTSSSARVVTTWLEDPRIRKISFTGSTPVGRVLLRQAAGRIVNASMELGGNAPFIVTEDADVEAAVAGALIAKFRGGGQACTAANRFYVHDAVAKQFIDRFGRAVAALNVGAATQDDTQIGPMINAKARADLSDLVDEAVIEGARVSHRSDIPDVGYFYPPTVLVDVPPTAAILDQELFGPVAPIVTYRDEEEMIRLVNCTEMGLAAYVYAGDLKHALQLAERVDAGMVGVNRGVVSDPAAPFGGTKQSGLGREGARHGIREYQEIQYYSVDWS